MEQYSVYMHVNKVNDKKYIGITKQTPEARWGTNGRNYQNRCPHFWSSIQKYGWNNFEHIVVASGLSKEDACNMEIDLIAKYRTQDKNFGYNILEGGTAPSLPEEVRKKMSISMRGNKNGAGHPCSEEKKKKISEAQKGRKFSEERRKHLSEVKKGKPHAPCSEETRKRISDSHEKFPVYCEETGIVYPSIQGCAKELGVQATLVCRCCKGKQKSTGGFHFSYYKDEECA